VVRGRFATAKIGDVWGSGLEGVLNPNMPPLGGTREGDSPGCEESLLIVEQSENTPRNRKEQTLTKRVSREGGRRGATTITCKPRCHYSRLERSTIEITQRGHEANPRAYQAMLPAKQALDESDPVLAPHRKGPRTALHRSGITAARKKGPGTQRLHRRTVVDLTATAGAVETQRQTGKPAPGQWPGREPPTTRRITSDHTRQW
jgi:hypothetical protein